MQWLREKSRARGALFVSGSRPSWFLLILAVIFSWAFSARAIERADPTNHVIRANREGLATHPVTDEPFASARQFEGYLDQIFDRAEAFGIAHSEPSNVVVKLLVHVHGGLNGFEDTQKRIELVSKMMQETNYPVFLVWPSSFFGTYGDHLLNIRQGHKVIRLYGILSLPVVFLLDVTSAIVTAPRHWLYQVQNSKDRAVAGGFLPHSLLNRSWRVEDRMVQALTNPPTEAPIYQSRYLYNFGEKVGRAAEDTLETPFRATIGTLLQSTMAQESWRNMNRRTSLLFYPSPMFDLQTRNVSKGINDIQGRSAGAFFRALISRVQTSRARGVKYQITFIGHSMGAIVLNKLFTEYRNELIETRCMQNIVYMAAACSINSGVNAIKPLLLAYNTNFAQKLPDRSALTEPTLRFYNLTLNRVAEISERNAAGFAPCGSLLDNIDDHLESPDTPLDRTLGSEVNVLSAVELFQDVFRYCEFKSFDRMPGYYPAGHGQFHLCPFWRPTFWAKDYFIPEEGTRLHPTKRNCYPNDWIKQERLGKHF
jgi:hypothetical protein